MKMKVRNEPLSEQFDHVPGNYIEKVKEKYAPPIGLFLIAFSSLEHSLDLHLADQLSDRSHQFGYVVIGGMSLHSKIELLRKLVGGLIKGEHPKHAANLQTNVKRLHAVRVFRNYIAHANWNTLENTGYVRTRIDESNGEVIFKRVRITPEVINAWIRRVIAMERKLDDFFENI